MVMFDRKTLENFGQLACNGHFIPFSTGKVPIVLHGRGKLIDHQILITRLNPSNGRLNDDRKMVLVVELW